MKRSTLKAVVGLGGTASWDVLGCVLKTEPRGETPRWRRQIQKQKMVIGWNRGDSIRNRGDDEGERQRRLRKRKEMKIE